MSEQPAATGQGPVIARAGKRKWGYDTAQVDEFLARAHTLYEADRPQLTQRDIQSVSFDLVKDGYAIAQVDAALSRLERAVVDKHTSWELAHGGRVPFKVRSEEMLSQLEGHASREPKHRFKDGEGKKPSYDRKQVDRVVDQVIAKASSALGAQGALPADSKELLDVTASRVANVIFTQRKGKRGYDERAVDYYLDVAVQLLSRLESFARVSDYTAEAAEPKPAAAPAPVQPAPVAPAAPAVQPAAFTPQSAPAAPTSVAQPAAPAASPAQAVPSLFAAAGAAASAAGAAAVASGAVTAAAANAHAAAERESFDALNAAERSIFAARPTESAAQPAPAAPAQPEPAAPAAPVASSSTPSFMTRSAAPAAAVPAPAPAVPEASAAAPVTPAPIAEAPAASTSLAALAQSVPQHTQVESTPTEAIAPVTEEPAPAPVPAPVTPAPAAPAEPEPVAPAAPVQSLQTSAPAPLIAEPVSAQPVVDEAKDDQDKAKDAKKDESDPDQYLANLLMNTSFPKIDLDIPNLSFPSLSDDGDDIIDTPKQDGDQQSR